MTGHSERATADTSGVRFPPPLVYVAGLLAGWLLERVVDMPPLDQLWSGILSIVCFVAGMGLIVSALGLFRIAKTDPLPMRPTTSLVLRGPYRFTRNPMYVGMALAYAGFSLVFNTVWPLLVLPLVLIAMVRLVISREEAYLEAVFGEDYRAFKRDVRRWL